MFAKKQDLPTEPNPTGRSWPAWLAAIGLCTLTAIVYGPTLRNGYVSDDSGYVVSNFALRSLEGLYNIWFTIGTVQQYYPLVFTMFWGEYQLWGLHPAGYHAVNLVLHAAAVLLLWRVLLRLEVPGAWLAAAIFAVHPVEVESVAWISERKNVLSCVLVLAAMLSYWRFAPPEVQNEQHHRGPRESLAWRFYALAMLLFIGALLSKTVTASMPAVLLVILWWKRGRLTLGRCHTASAVFRGGHWPGHAHRVDGEGLCGSPRRSLQLHPHRSGADRRPCGLVLREQARLAVPVDVLLSAVEDRSV